MNVAINEEMTQKVEKPKSKKVGKLALINKAFDEEGIYTQVNATHAKPISVAQKNATKNITANITAKPPANSKLIQLDVEDM